MLKLLGLELGDVRRQLRILIARLGISMAGWNAILSLGGAAAIFGLARSKA